MEKSITFHGDRLAWSSHHHRDELQSSASVDTPFPSSSVLGLHDFLAKAIWTDIDCLRLRQNMPLRLLKGH